jgi:hypothetical protein
VFLCVQIRISLKNVKNTQEMKKILIGLLLVIIPFKGICQENRLSESIISIAEELAADESDPEAVSLYIEKLYELFENPVRINSADKDEISRLFFLSDFQVKILSEYINSSGMIISVYEIPNLPGFDKETVIMMTPFISLDAIPEADASYSSWRNTLLTNIIWKQGDEDSSLLGSPVKILTKYKFNAAGFSGGLIAEKDPGEKLLSGDPPLPDMVSGHVSWDGKGFIRRVIIGDYAARFGQGTNINTGIRTGLSLHAPGYVSARNEIRSYTSSDENNFFRGAAVEFSFRNLAASAFYSRNSIDASLDSGSNSVFIKSFYISGLHNTSSSLQKKDAITDMVYGINLSYNLKNIRIGTTWSEERFSLPVESEISEPEKRFDFTGNRNSIYSFYYNSLINKILCYGEFSLNNMPGYAALQGVTIRPSDRLGFNLLYRYYGVGYFSFHGNGPGGTSTTGTVKSILGNFMFEAAKHLFISGGCEIQEYPWFRYRTSSPSYRIKREIRMRFIPSEKLLIEGAYYYNLSTADSYERNRIPELKKLTTRSFSTSFRYSIYDNLTLGTRIYYKLAEHTESRGMLLLQEMNYKFRNIPLTLWVRYSLFNTDDWDTRIYTYENDLLYSYSIPALYGRGSRNYLMADWRISDKAEVRLKYGILSKPQTGNDNAYSEEFRFQIRIFI